MNKPLAKGISPRVSFGRMGDLLKGLRLPSCPQLPHRGTFVAPLNSGLATLRLGSLVILLQGCVTTQPEAVKVYINVPVPCVTTNQLPITPKISSNEELAKLTDGKLITTIAAERLDLKRYAAESAALLVACAS